MTKQTVQIVHSNADEKLGNGQCKRLVLIGVR